MAHNNSSSEPVSVQGGSQNKLASKKPSAYIFDSNGDTQLILNTNNHQSLIWEAETIQIRQERSTTKSSRKEKKKNKKKSLFFPPPPESPPLALPESHVSIPTTFSQTTDSFSAFSNVAFSLPVLSDDETIGPASADAEKNADSASLRMQDWVYGKKSGNLPNQVEIRMLVSGKHLILASSYFEKMLSGPFTEGQSDRSGLRQVTASDWDPEAFETVLTIMHGYHRDVPRSLSLETLAKLAIIVDYYECHEIVELYAGIWLEKLESQVPTVYGRDCVLLIFISWVFSQPEIFQKMTRVALKHSGKLIEAQDFPIPADILEQIDIARLDYLDKIFSATYELLDRLQDEQECSYECSSMLLGVLTKELKRHGMLSPRGARPFYGFSIEGSKGIIEGYKQPYWFDRGRYAPVHSCTIQQKLSLAQEKAENELRVFNLQDFQPVKSHMHPPKNVGAFEFECKRKAT